MRSVVSLINPNVQLPGRNDITVIHDYLIQNAAPFTDAPHLPDSPENPDNPEIPDSKVFILLVILFKSGQFRVIVQHIAMYR